MSLADVRYIEDLDEPDRKCLQAVHWLHCLQAGQIRALIQGEKASTRKRIKGLVEAGYLQKVMHNNERNQEIPVYVLAELGALLCNARDLASACTVPPEPIIRRWIAANSTILQLHQAVQDSSVKVVNHAAHYNAVPADSGQFKPQLHTTFADESFYCDPDVGFLLDDGSKKRVVYVEHAYCNNMDSKNFVTARASAYQELSRTQRHKEHFPASTERDFYVLTVLNNRTNLRDVSNLTSGIDRPDLWLFATHDYLRDNCILRKRLFKNHEDLWVGLMDDE